MSVPELALGGLSLSAPAEEHHSLHPTLETGSFQPLESARKEVLKGKIPFVLPIGQRTSLSPSNPSQPQGGRTDTALTWLISSCSLSASSSVSSLMRGSLAWSLSLSLSRARRAARSALSRRSASSRAFFSLRSFCASLLWWLKASVISWGTKQHPFYN